VHRVVQGGRRCWAVVVAADDEAAGLETASARDAPDLLDAGLTIPPR
jgi:hypothetical protein